MGESAHRLLWLTGVHRSGISNPGRACTSKPGSINVHTAQECTNAEAPSVFSVQGMDLALASSFQPYYLFFAERLCIKTYGEL